MSERHDSAWWRNQYPGWPSMSRGRMEMLFSDLAATEAEVKALREAFEEMRSLEMASLKPTERPEDSWIIGSCDAALGAVRRKEETPCK